MNAFGWARNASWFSLGVSVAVVLLFGAIMVQGSTTISTSISTGSTLSVTGLSTLTAGYVSQASSTVVGAFTTTGTAIFNGLASSTTLTVGSDQVSTVSGLIHGFCTVAATTLTAASSTYSTCTGATGLTSSYRVFVQATSSLPAGIFIDAASTTGTTGTIGLRFWSHSATAGNISAATVSLNFWAVR